MMPRHATIADESRSLHRKTFAPRGVAVSAPQDAIASHDPSVRERLEVASAHLRLARSAAGAGLATWLLRREVDLAGREIRFACRALRAAVRRDAEQGAANDRLTQAAAELQRSTRNAARLLDEPIATHR